MLGDSFHILLDNGFYHLYFRWLKAMIIYKFHWKQVKLCLGSTFHYMHMNGCVVVGIEQKPITKKREYRRHDSLDLTAKVGNKFITRKFFNRKSRKVF